MLDPRTYTFLKNISSTGRCKLKILSFDELDLSIFTDILKSFALTSQIIIQDNPE